MTISASKKAESFSSSTCGENAIRNSRARSSTTPSSGASHWSAGCGFDFNATYGTCGSGYIECHHRTPLGVTGQTHTLLADLALICSNCHRMIHPTRISLTVE
ncbi:HNH endonuclease [Kribbella sp. GL6]|uniref:HNH endonuclease n=1 Tax=Kribbella sp. GL6 TaxID=3419765 RepID=UPI003D00A795